MQNMKLHLFLCLDFAKIRVRTIDQKDKTSAYLIEKHFVSHNCNVSLLAIILYIQYMYISNPTRDICKNAAEHGSRVHALPFQPELT